MNPTSDDLKMLLRDRHAGEFWADEAMTGPSGSMRFDFWAMKPSWVNFSTLGYEIKVSRGDFLGDKKWRTYLDYCSEFYFCCPVGLIKPDELPPEAGLIYSSVNCKRLFIKKKAPERKVDPAKLNRILLHYLFWHYGKNFKKSSAENWLECLKKRKELGYELQAKINKRVEEEVGDLRDKNQTLENENKVLGEIKLWAKENSVDFSTGYWHSAQRRLNELVEAQAGRIKDNKLIDRAKELRKELGYFIGEALGQKEK